MTFIENSTSQRFPLTYCMNVHPLDSLEATYHCLDAFTVPIRREVMAPYPMGVGLWFSQEVAQELEDSEKREDFRLFLEERNLFAFTLNGFPQTNFHAPIVKEKVYLPHWGDPRRLEYSKTLAGLLVDLLPTFMDYGSISTSPLHFKGEKGVDPRREIEHLLDLAYYLHRLEGQTGKKIVFCLEPEPLCALEKTSEVVDFFRERLWPEARRLSEKFEVSKEEALAILKEHLGICWDTCHQAVEFENPRENLEKITSAGIKIGKVQLSNALEIRPGETSLDVLKPFARDRYLHQVFGRDIRGRIHWTRDLPEIFKDDRWKKMEVLRVHYHIPLFCENLGELATTLPHMKESLDFFLTENYPTHLEVETYTWEVLPQREAWQGEELWRALAREMKVILDYAEKKWSFSVVST